MIFEKAGYQPESVRFFKLAIEFASPEQDTSDLWRKVISGYTELDMFEDAYMALVTAPYESMWVVGHARYNKADPSLLENERRSASSCRPCVRPTQWIGSCR